MTIQQGTLWGIDPILAIDVNPYGSRATLVHDGIRLDDATEAKRGQEHRIARFVQKHRREWPYLEVVGSSCDPWSDELKQKLQEGGTTRWLAPGIVTPLQWHWGPWQAKRRLLRARLLAYLAHRIPSARTHFPCTGLILQWEYLMAQEAIAEIQAAADAQDPLLLTDYSRY